LPNLPPVLEDFQQINLFPTSPAQVVVNLLVALSCGIILALSYRFSYKGPSYSITFVNSLIMLSLISAMVVLVIGNNVARAFGLVGALSIIRFRTAIRDTMDLVHIFLALVVGMAAGVGLSFVSVLGTLLSSLLVFLLNFTHITLPRKRQHLLQLTFDGQQADNEHMAALLKIFCRSVRLVSLRNVDETGIVEGHYHVVMRQQDRSQEFISKLMGLGSVKQAYLYFDEDDYNAPLT
jgi:uncharacterized membrane protein YhiD involved in acid resistance